MEIAIAHKHTEPYEMNGITIHIFTCTKMIALRVYTQSFMHQSIIAFGSFGIKHQSGKRLKIRPHLYLGAWTKTTDAYDCRNIEKKSTTFFFDIREHLLQFFSSVGALKNVAPTT